MTAHARSGECPRRVSYAEVDQTLPRGEGERSWLCPYFLLQPAAVLKNVKGATLRFANAELRWDPQIASEKKAFSKMERLARSREISARDTAYCRLRITHGCLQPWAILLS